MCKANKPVYRDYSLDGPESRAAVEKGLASAEWFVPHINRDTLRRLSKRDDYHAIRDTVILLAVLVATGWASYQFWRQASYVKFALSFWVYCTFYTSCGDSRWHECGHGTAFKTKWMNDLL